MNIQFSALQPVERRIAAQAGQSVDQWAQQHRTAVRNEYGDQVAIIGTKHFFDDLDAQYGISEKIPLVVATGRDADLFERVRSNDNPKAKAELVQNLLKMLHEIGFWSGVE